jgi:phage-related baseplate assembly protein
MSTFSAIELDKLPAPNIIEVLDYESILTDLVDSLIVIEPSLEGGLELESEPSRKILELLAYRELILRQRINQAAKATMLAYANDADLDHIGGTFKVKRLLIKKGNADTLPPTDDIYESDDNFRRRIQLSLEGYSVAGPEGAYKFHALSAHADALDISATSPSPGVVLISVLSRVNNGSADAILLNAIQTTLSAEDVRPLTDQVIVQSANIINYAIDATLYFLDGPDKTVVLTQANEQLANYIEKSHRIAHDITLSGIYAALHQPGVQRVELHSPANDIIINEQSAAYCNNVTMNDGGNGD